MATPHLSLAEKPLLQMEGEATLCRTSGRCSGKFGFVLLLAGLGLTVLRQLPAQEPVAALNMAAVTTRTLQSPLLARSRLPVAVRAPGAHAAKRDEVDEVWQKAIIELPSKTYHFEKENREEQKLQAAENKKQQKREQRAPRAVAPRAPSQKDKLVVVVGAGGRTGSLVLEQLIARGWKARGIVRSDDKAKKIQDKISKALEVEGSSVPMGVADALDEASLLSQFQGADSIIVCSSAVPQIKKRSLILVPYRMLTGRKAVPSFRWPAKGTPKEVDYIGAKNIFEAAKKAGVRRIVLVGSMGGTQPDNFLNTIGDNGNILVWKRKAEMELLSSGLEFTIIHPGGLIDDQGGQRELVVGVNDELMASDHKSVPRSDVASMAIACVDCKYAKNKAFDLASLPEDVGSGPTPDLSALVASLGSKTCDYSINKPPS